MRIEKSSSKEELIVLEGDYKGVQVTVKMPTVKQMTEYENARAANKQGDMMLVMIKTVSNWSGVFDEEDKPLAFNERNLSLAIEQDPEFWATLCWDHIIRFFMKGRKALKESKSEEEDSMS